MYPDPDPPLHPGDEADNPYLLLCFAVIGTGCKTNDRCPAPGLATPRDSTVVVEAGDDAVYEVELGRRGRRVVKRRRGKPAERLVEVEGGGGGGSYGR